MTADYENDISKTIRELPADKKVAIISLGCTKNTTDSEVLLGKLSEANITIEHDPDRADIVIINTCAFLKDARLGSLDLIKYFSKSGKLVYVAGCLPKYQKNIASLKLPNVRYIDSVQLYSCDSPRVKFTPAWFAFVKIAEGCNNSCSYCLIPKIRGKYQARERSDILQEVSNLADKGLKEVNYVAQETTAFPKLTELLVETARIKGLKWIRLMYAHPKHIDQKIIDVMKNEKKIVKYLDMPIQHASDRILRKMNRNKPKKAELFDLIQHLRRSIPDLAIKTTVIVGFPGESEKEFNELCDFIEEVKFNRLNIFEYSRENGTRAAKLPGQVHPAVKAKRYRRLTDLNEKISKQLMKEWVGREVEVLYEGENSARLAQEAPAVDGAVRISSLPTSIKPGTMIKVKITSSGVYDLAGKYLSEQRASRAKVYH